MRWRSTVTSTRVAVCLAVLGVGSIATLVADLGASSSPVPTLSPADVVALRFPADWDDAAPAPNPPAALRATDPQQAALLSPFPTYQLASVDSYAVPAPEQVSAPIAPMAPSAAPATAHVKTPAPVHAVPTGRPGAVLNDSQISSIKKRLNLTRDQERMWPAVASALRDISYKKNPPDTRKKAQISPRTAAIDPESVEVQRLKSAAFPLVMSFNQEQKSEVRTLVHVIGLEKLAESF